MFVSYIYKLALNLAELKIKKNIRMKNLKFIIVIIFVNVSFGQIPKGTIQYKYYEYCSENLSKLERSEVYPFFPTEDSFVGPFIYDQVKAIQSVSDFEVIVIKSINSGMEQSYDYQGIVVHQIKLLDIPSFLLPGLFNKLNLEKLTKKLVDLTRNNYSNCRL